MQYINPPHFFHYLEAIITYQFDLVMLFEMHHENNSALASSGEQYYFREKYKKYKTEYLYCIRLLRFRQSI
jgi:hypothetical protein